MKPKTSLSQKFFLVALGFLAAAVFLEIGLRLGGWTLLSVQRTRNYLAMKQKGTTRILCLGESTTAGQYPRFLEEELNRRNTGVKFSVIDGGLIGTNTFCILDNLPSSLDKYRPDMVVTMMGINDWGPHIPQELDSDSPAMRFLKSFKIYKLARLLGLHAAAEPIQKSADAGIDPEVAAACVVSLPSSRNHGKIPQAEIDLEAYYKDAIEENPANDTAYVALGQLCRNQGRHPEAERLFRKALEINPRYDRAYVELGHLYGKERRFSEAEAACRNALELNPHNDEAYVELGQLYRDQGKLTEVEESFRRAIELNPQKAWAYVELGYMRRSRSRTSEAEALFKRAIEIDPQDDLAYVALGGIYVDQLKVAEAKASFRRAIELNPANEAAYVALGSICRYPEAEAPLRRALELNPHNDEAYVALGRAYRDKDMFAQAEASFKKALEINPANEAACGALKVMYTDLGQSRLAREYDAKAQQIGYYSSLTVRSYRRLREILQERGIAYVCAQYPMRSLAPLKAIFEGKTEGVVFVDNEKIFRNALAQGRYSDYFDDMFGGDFGHCTEKGNRLLAENIADAILAEAFGR